MAVDQEVGKLAAAAALHRSEAQVGEAMCYSRSSSTRRMTDWKIKDHTSKPIRSLWLEAKHVLRRCFESRFWSRGNTGQM